MEKNGEELRIKPGLGVSAYLAACFKGIGRKAALTALEQKVPISFQFSDECTC